jgi:N utilization substance protein B
MDHKDYLRKVFYAFKSGDIFHNFIEIGEKTFEDQRNLLIQFFKDFLFPTSDYDATMEEFSLTWLDDKNLILNFVIKTLEAIEKDGPDNYITEFGQSLEEDILFSTKLFERTFEESNEFKKMIAAKTMKWDAERIAHSDFIMMQMAVCEMLRFPEIPIKVTINEYLDIAKLYSTPKSHVFINGILDKLMNELKEQGLISKEGRGLVDN